MKRPFHLFKGNERFCKHSTMEGTCQVGLTVLIFDVILFIERDEYDTDE